MKNDQATFQLQTNIPLNKSHRLAAALDLLIEHLLDEYADGRLSKAEDCEEDKKSSISADSSTSSHEGVEEIQENK